MSFLVFPVVALASSMLLVPAVYAEDLPLCLRRSNQNVSLYKESILLNTYYIKIGWDFTKTLWYFKVLQKKATLEVVKKRLITQLTRPRLSSVSKFLAILSNEFATVFTAAPSIIVSSFWLIEVIIYVPFEGRLRTNVNLQSIFRTYKSKRLVRANQQFCRDNAHITCELNLQPQPSTIHRKGLLPPWDITCLSSHRREHEVLPCTLHPCQWQTKLSLPVCVLICADWKNNTKL